MPKESPRKRLRLNPGGALAPEEVVGRDLLIAKLWTTLDRQSVMLTAERRMGKTSVLNKMLAEGRRGDAAEYFMAKVVRMPAEFVASARSQPWWAATEALAHTLPYDATIMGDYSIPEARAASVTVPTLVLDGGSSFGFMGATADALAKIIPQGQRRTLEGQEHNVDPNLLAPALKEFFAG